MKLAQCRLAFFRLAFFSTAMLVALHGFAQEPPSAATLPQVRHLIDTHIHLFDTNREGGVPWPPKNDRDLYKPHLPADIKQVARPAGVTGAVVVEASFLLEDNRWVLDLIDQDDYFLGLVGNIDPRRSDFPEKLALLARDRRFLGIRTRNQPLVDFTDPTVLANLRVLAEHDKTLDVSVHEGGWEAVERLGREIPNLRIVYDHVLGYQITGQPVDHAWLAALKKLAANRNLYCKVSAMYGLSKRRPAPAQLEYYQPLLDALWDAFGPDHLLYGSDWPVINKHGNYADYMKLVNTYFSAKGQEACEQFFWKNAVEAYRLDIKK